MIGAVKKRSPSSSRTSMALPPFAKPGRSVPIRWAMKVACFLASRRDAHSCPCMSRAGSSLAKSKKNRFMVEVNAAIIGQFLGRSGEIKARGRRDGPSSVSILRKPSALAGCRTSSPRSRTNRLWLAGFRPLRPLDPRGQARKSRQPSAAHAAHHAYPASATEQPTHLGMRRNETAHQSLSPKSEDAHDFSRGHATNQNVRGPHIFSRWEWPQDSGAW